MSFDRLLNLVPPPPPPINRKLRELSDMAKLAETDEGMKDLLDRAREYYVLKRNDRKDHL